MFITSNCLSTKSVDQCEAPGPEDREWKQNYWDIGSDMNYYLKAIISF